VFVPFFTKERIAVIHLTLNVLLTAASLAAGNQDYATAFKQVEQTGKPLVVLVGADWCPGCRTMKYSTLPQLEKSGELSKVAFAHVNTDEDSALASKLMKGGSIPQLVMFQKKPDGSWIRKQLTGAQSASSVQAFLNSAEVPPTKLSSN
jgi:thiol-disulfide isomerase/thioredoxin